MIASIATLFLGFAIGYLGQRSRLCFVSGYRDFVLTHDTTLLKGVGGAFLGALAGYVLFNFTGGSVPGFPMILQTSVVISHSAWIITIVSGLGVGIIGALSGGCPYRMHVLAAEGKKTYWVYLLGFYAGLVFYDLVTVHLMDMLRTVLR
ncbi:MAG: YeeE/YedE thiosulfate transporter family protein [Anaerolineales bacterium]